MFEQLHVPIGISINPLEEGYGPISLTMSTRLRSNRLRSRMSMEYVTNQCMTGFAVTLSIVGDFCIDEMPQSSLIKQQRAYVLVCREPTGSTG